MNNVVIITGPGFEDSEVVYPYYRLQEEGYVVDVVTSNDSVVKGKHGYPLAPTVRIRDLQRKKYDIVVIPGGHEAPDRVRQVKAVLDFVKEMHKKGNLITSTCHGPWVLISAGIMKRKKATCYKGMKDDLINAGAVYRDEPVVIDGNIITSDHPNHLAEWMKATIIVGKKQIHR